jgi:hypothetical protein
MMAIRNATHNLVEASWAGPRPWDGRTTMPARTPMPIDPRAALRQGFPR